MFNKSNFDYSGGYLVYFPEGFANTRNRQFVARFKYRGPFSKAVFFKELLKNHTPESYFKAMETQSPLEILRASNPVWYEKTLASFKKKKGIL
jgi:hypothetical protein